MPAATLPSLLDEFATLRRQSLDELRGWQLEDAQLDWPGRHPRLGRSRSASCWPRGWCTTWDTSPRSRA